MRWPRPRFTVRRMMLVVAAAAFLMEGGVLWRSGYYRTLAARNGKKAERERAMLDWFARREGMFCNTYMYKLIDLARKRAEHFESLSRKYEAAAGHSWLVVSADPPEPR